MENNNFDEHLETEETASNDLLQATQDQLEQTKRQLLSLGADFQNYKKRIEKDRLLWTQTTRAELLLQLLPIVDDFDRALQGDINTDGLAL
ncbi:MAG: nucleotide exchange factor GrpE, partial [Gammaproteobacteria bacterium]|nr:nucleotide exchange factor GrpE [Gammaproteobacteria bacterium]